VIFGDSLSDNGEGDGELFDHEYPLPPYYKFRFSNGPVWIELFPATDLLDFAYDGSLINQTAPSFGGPGSLMAQINVYLIANHFNLSSIAEETLYVFWGGANDIYYALSNQTVTPQGVNDGLTEIETGIPLLATEQVRCVPSRPSRARQCSKPSMAALYAMKSRLNLVPTSEIVVSKEIELSGLA
jgi:phospholipase/lecithinase/hemolysin